MESEWFERLPVNYWKNPNNQRNFFREFAEKYGIKNPRDWGNVTRKQLEDAGGTALLYRFRGNIRIALQSSFPG